MTSNLKTIAGFAFASYLTGCSALQGAANADTQPAPAPAPATAPAPQPIIYINTDGQKVSGPTETQMVAPLINGRSYLVGPQVEGLSQDEFDTLAKWYITLGRSANAAMHYHVSKPKPQQLMQGRQAADLIAALDPAKAYNEKEISQTIFKAVHEMLQELDPHSDFLPPVASHNFSDAVEGQFTGLGISLEADDNGVKLKSVSPNSPAEQAGLKAGDIVTHSNGTALQGFTPKEFAALIDQDQNFTFNLIRDGKALPDSLSVTKGIVKIDSVSSRVFNGEIAHIHIGMFSQDTHEEFRSHVGALKEQFGDQIKGMIIDVRGNGGGSLDAVGEIIDYLLTEKDLLYTYNAVPRGFNKMALIGEDNNEITGLPISVLIDNRSASAAEILAGVLQDHKRATILGQSSSYGKATAQQLFHTELPDGQTATLKLTSGYIFLPKTGSYQLTGISPDILTPMAARYKEYLTKNTGHNFEADQENALSVPAKKGVIRAASARCEITNDTPVLGVFNMKTQSLLSDFDATEDTASLCAIDLLTGKNGYSLTIKTQAIAAPQPAS
jgi:carboxyl-terminal processing protease